MAKSSNRTLEFDTILEELSLKCLSQNAKDKCLALTPFLSVSICKTKMVETSEGKEIIELLGMPPLASMHDFDKILELATKGSMLIPEQLNGIVDFIYACKRMTAFLKKAEQVNIDLGYYGGAFNELSYLYDEINRSIRYDKVDDNASTTLHSTRRKIEGASTAVKDKLNDLLRSNKNWFVDGYIATRNGQQVLPVKKEFKNQISGTVVDTSGSGSTFFILPSAVRKLQEKLSILIIEEENEVRKILYTLTSLVDEHIKELKINMDCMETLDFTFAKAKLSMDMNAISVPVKSNRHIKIINGRHPSLAQADCVPLDFEIGGDVTGIIITGPNTGGKTVALKTVGLLSMMAQSGLHVPVQTGSEFCMHNAFLCDIGDRKSVV